MIQLLSRFMTLFGTVGALAMAIALAAEPANAQLRRARIIGGQADFSGGQIFVPDSNLVRDSNGRVVEVDGRAVVFSPVNGELIIQNVEIQTPFGTIPSGEGSSVLFRNTTSPEIYGTRNNPIAGRAPAVGDLGNVQGNITFAGFDRNGSPVFFNNVPASMDFQINSITERSPSEASTQYRTPPDYVLGSVGTILSEDGLVVTLSAQPVLLYQVQPQGTLPSDSSYFGLPIPADQFANSVDGTSYFSDFSTSLDGGFVFVPRGFGTGEGNGRGFGNNFGGGDDDFGFGGDDDFGFGSRAIELNITFGSSSTYITTFQVDTSDLTRVPPGLSRIPPGQLRRLSVFGPSSRIFPGLIGFVITDIEDDDLFDDDDDIFDGEDDGFDDDFDGDDLDDDNDDDGDDVVDGDDDIDDDADDDIDDIDDGDDVADDDDDNDDDVDDIDDDDDVADDDDDDTTIVVGSIQDLPILPNVIAIGVFFFENVASGNWFDPPLTSAYQYSMASDSTFTAITGFPEGIDADDQFIVTVGDVELGAFGPGDTVNFSDYAEELGDLLVDGGVSSFVVSAIDPAVDVEDPEGFPLRIEFNSPSASFEMRAVGVEEGTEEPTL